MKRLTRSRTLILLSCATLIGLSGVAFAGEEDEETATTGEPAFVGVAKCKMCHKSEADGEQFRKWSESAHARAWTELASEKAKAIATKKGLGDPQKEAACLRCHVTGHGQPAERFGAKFKVEDGVGCESCHGAGSGYWKKTVMEDHKLAVAAGMLVPDEKTCRGCHNQESPTFKPFDFAARSAEIAHPKPKPTPGG